MGSIMIRIQALGVEIQHIPGGCTYFCQPVNVGVNYPIKKDDGAVGGLDAQGWRTGGRDFKDTDKAVSGSVDCWHILSHQLGDGTKCMEEDRLQMDFKLAFIIFA